MNVLSLEGLAIGTPDGRLRVVEEVGFALAPGEVLALVGESGAGKTATGRALLGLLPPGLAVLGGEARFLGQPLPIDRPARLRAFRGAGIGMVFQEPATSLNPALTIGTQIAAGVALHQRLDRAEIRRRTVEMLSRVGLDRPGERLAAYPHEFSGGMRQRIMLASVMALRPRLLIADEPTTALDTLGQAEVLRLMLDLAGETGTAVLFITHNLGLVLRHASRALVMHRGRIVDEGSPIALLATPRADYTGQLVAALPRRSPARAPITAPPLIEAQRLSATFPGRRHLWRRRPETTVVKDVSLMICPGEMVALVGASGAGKTTLGRALLRLAPISSGRILHRGQDITAIPQIDLSRFRQDCQIVFQDPYSSLDPRQRVGAILAEPLRHVALTAAERAARVAEALDEVALAGLGNRFPHELSGGQRQRVAIARALIRRPAFLVADEPLSSLDMTIQRQVLTLLRNLQDRHGFSCLFISHDLTVVEEIADRVLVMFQGEIVEEGPRDRIFDAPRHPHTRALLAAAPRLGARQG